MSNTDDRPYCTDCPDREVCREGYPCDIVRTINDTSPKGTITMSSNPNAKPGQNAPKNNGEGEKTGRNTGPDAATAKDNLIETSKGLGAYINARAIRGLKDEGLSNEEIADKTGLTPFAVLAVLSEDELKESPVEKLKGFFTRNKKAVIGAGSAIAAAGLAVLVIYVKKDSADAVQTDDVEITVEQV